MDRAWFCAVIGLAPRAPVRESTRMTSQPETILREATVADAPAIVALWRSCGLTRPWNDPLADFNQALAGASSTIFVADEEAGIAGSVMVGFDGHRGWVYYLAVDPAFRERGLGRRLMGVAELWLRGLGAPKIQLMVRDDNHAALGFYEALGLERQKVVTLGKFLKD